MIDFARSNRYKRTNGLKAWGWKDPRNTFTLPMWLSIFPKARVLHVLRNKEWGEGPKRVN